MRHRYNFEPFDYRHTYALLLLETIKCLLSRFGRDYEEPDGSVSRAGWIRFSRRVPELIKTKPDGTTYMPVPKDPNPIRILGFEHNRCFGSNSWIIGANDYAIALHRVRKRGHMGWSFFHMDVGELLKTGRIVQGPKRDVLGYAVKDKRGEEVYPKLTQTKLNSFVKFLFSHLHIAVTKEKLSQPEPYDELGEDHIEGRHTLDDFFYDFAHGGPTIWGYDYSEHMELMREIETECDESAAREFAK
jgi:hypothetical protein